MRSAIRKQNTKRAAWLYLLPSVLLILMFLGIPILLSVVTSFQFNKLNVPGTYFTGFDNYTNVVTERYFAMTLRNTAYWVIYSVTFQFFLGLALALLLNQHFRFKGLYQGLVLLPWAVPGFLTAMVWKWMLNGQYGVVNDLLMRLGLIGEPIPFLAQTSTSLPSVIAANIWYGVPFFAIMLLSALQSIPGDVYEAADIDGAGVMTKFFRITLSYIKPTILSTALLRVIWIFNSADLIYIMTSGGPRNSSATMATYILRKAFSDMNFGQASALGVLFLLILGTYTVAYLAASRFEQAGDF